jgi:hypothetical protein
MRRLVGWLVVVCALCGAAPASAQGYAAENEANRLMGRIGAAVGKVRAAAERARASRDVVQLTCMNDKLLQAEVAERSAAEKRAGLRTAIFEESEEAKHTIEVLEALAARAEQLVNEAAQCVGQQMGEVVRVVAGASTDSHGGGGGGDYQVRTKDLEKRVDELKDSVRRSQMRNALLHETVLAGSVANAAPAAATPAAPAAPPPAASPFARDAAHDSSMLIRTADLTLAVFEVDKNLEAVESTAREAGGYLAAKSDRQITIRIPRERFDDTVKRIEKLGDVLHRNIAAEDVTDQYVDLEMRLKNAIAVRDRLEKLLLQATVKDAIEIQKELAKTTEEIERLQGKMKLLRDRISYSTITVTFERSQPKGAVQNRALLPFPWMNTMGLGPLLTVTR